MRPLEIVGLVKARARPAHLSHFVSGVLGRSCASGLVRLVARTARACSAARPDQPAKRRTHYSTRYDKDAGKFAAPTGPLTIVVSIAKQRVTLFSDGKQIAEAPVSTGTAGHETPLGIFAVISKARYHESNLYSSAPMPYMERITWSGVALHEGPLPGHAASHGCIRLPGAFAASLFKITKLGARVVIVRDPVAPVEFKSARLFTPKSGKTA